MPEGTSEGPIVIPRVEAPYISPDLGARFPGQSVIEILHTIRDERAGRALAATATDEPAPIVRSFADLNPNFRNGVGRTEDVSELAGPESFHVANEYR